MSVNNLWNHVLIYYANWAFLMMIVELNESKRDDLIEDRVHAYVYVDAYVCI